MYGPRLVRRSLYSKAPLLRLCAAGRTHVCPALPMSLHHRGWPVFSKAGQHALHGRCSNITEPAGSWLDGA